MSTVQETVDVVVIGGGISGLSAAKLLKEQGLEVVVLEARGRVGGRTHTVRNDKCGYTDVGGAYIGPGQRRVARMAKEFGLEFYKIHHSQKTVMNVQGTWRTYRGTIPPVYNPLVLLDLNNFECLIETMSAEVPVDSPWKAPKAKEWDAMTFKEFIDKNLWTNTSKFFATTVVRGLMCVEPEEISLLHCLWYIKSGQGLQRITSVDDGAQERKFVGGAQQLSECMADGLDDQVKLSSPVVRVIQEEEVVTVMTLDGKVYKGQYIVSAMPLSLLNRVTFDPPLPPMKIQMIQRMPMGSIVKTMTFYDKPYWREKSLCGEMVCDKSPIIYCVDDTKPDGSYPCIMGFILADRAREFCDLSKEERMHAVANQYAEVFKCEEMRKPVHYEEQNWMAEEYSGGCYVSCMPPGAMTRYSQELRVPFKRVYFATTETATCWAGYMEGAIQAGERAAREILHDLGRIPSSQIWQDEPEHDNFPDVPVKHLHEPYLPSVTQLLWMAAIAALGVAVYACNYMSKL